MGTPIYSDSEPRDPVIELARHGLRFEIDAFENGGKEILQGFSVALLKFVRQRREHFRHSYDILVQAPLPPSCRAPSLALESSRKILVTIE